MLAELSESFPHIFMDVDAFIRCFVANRRSTEFTFFCFDGIINNLIANVTTGSMKHTHTHKSPICFYDKWIKWYFSINIVVRASVYVLWMWMRMLTSVVDDNANVNDNDK